MSILQKNKWSIFWAWYEKHTTESLLVTAIIIYMQIPHMVWAGDVYLQTGMISHIHPLLDFFLYGIDTLEMIPIIGITLAIVAKVRHKV